MISSIILILAGAFVLYVSVTYVIVPLMRALFLLIKTIKLYQRFSKLPAGHEWSFSSMTDRIFGRYKSIIGNAMVCTKCGYSVQEMLMADYEHFHDNCAPHPVLSKSFITSRDVYKIIWVEKESYCSEHPTCTDVIMKSVLE